MTSDVGILKIGIADDPLRRLEKVKALYPIITGFYRAWGMSRRQAAFVERMVHRRLIPYHHENELFRMTKANAETEIETVISTLGFTAFPFVPLPPPDKKPRKKQKERAKKPKLSRAPFTLRLEDDLRERAERVAKAENRTLTSLVTHALAREVAAIESARRKSRDPVTAAPSR